MARTVAEIKEQYKNATFKGKAGLDLILEVLKEWNNDRGLPLGPLPRELEDLVQFVKDHSGAGKREFLFGEFHPEMNKMGMEVRDGVEAAGLDRSMLSVNPIWTDALLIMLSKVMSDSYSQKGLPITTKLGVKRTFEVSAMNWQVARAYKTIIPSSIQIIQENREVAVSSGSRSKKVPDKEVTVSFQTAETREQLESLDPAYWNKGFATFPEGKGPPNEYNPTA